MTSTSLATVQLSRWALLHQITAEVVHVLALSTGGHTVDVVLKSLAAHELLVRGTSTYQYKLCNS